MKRSLTLWINTPLIERLDSRARLDGRNRINLIEQALAEYLNVPLADRDLPAQPVELCPACQRALIDDNGRCQACRWHRDPRRSYKPAVRARVEASPKTTKPVEAA